MAAFARRLWKWLASVAALLLILVGIGLGMLRLFAPLAPELRADVEQAVSKALNVPVQIGRLHLEFEWLQPELVLQDVRLLTPEGSDLLVAADELRVLFAFEDLFHLETFRPHRVRLYRPEFSARRAANGDFFLNEFLLVTANNEPVNLRRLARLLLQRADVEIQDANVRYVDETLSSEEWNFRDIDLHFVSQGDEHTILITLVPPNLLGESLLVEVHANGVADGPENWDWQARLEANALDVETVREHIAWAGLGKLEAKLDFSADIRGHGASRLDANGSFSARDLLMRSAGQSTSALQRDVTEIRFDWTLQATPAGSRIDIEHLVMESAEQDWPESFIAVAVEHPSGTPMRLRLAANVLDLAFFPGLVAALPTGATGAQWALLDEFRNASPSGQLHELVLDIPLQETADAAWNVQGRADNLAINRTEHWPGFAGVSLAVTGNQLGGRISFHADDASVDMPNLFRDVLTGNQLDLTVDWTRMTDQWRLKVADGQLNTPAARLLVNGVLHLPDTNGAQIDLNAEISDIDLAQKSAYLPAGVMAPPLVKWLDDAVISGRVPKAEFTWRGAIAEFPYRNSESNTEGNGDGEFSIRFRMQDTVLDVASGWPLIEDLVMDVHFTGPGMNTTVISGTTAGLELVSATTDFPDFHQGDLSVAANIEGDAEQYLGYFAASPLAQPLSGLLEHVSLQGPVASRVTLDIPIMHPADTRVDGRAKLVDVTAGSEILPWPVERLRGELRATEHGAWATSLQGEFMQSPIVISVDSKLRDDRLERIAIAFDGTADIRRLDRWLPNGWVDYLDGEFAFAAQLDIPVGEPENKEHSRFRLHTSLQGVASNLPAPFDRPAGIAWPTTLELSFPEEDRFSLAALVPERFGLGIEFHRANDVFEATRGELAFGADRFPVIVLEQGMRISGVTPLFRPFDWIEMQRELATSEQDFLQQLDFRAGQLELANYRFDDQQIEASRTVDGWKFVTEGERLAGVVEWHPQQTMQDSQLSLDFDRVLLTEHAAGGKTKDMDPRNLPNMRIDLRNLVYDDYRIGNLRGDLSRNNIGLLTQNLAASGDEYELALQGRWEQLQDNEYTSVAADLTSRDLARTLMRYAYRAGIESSKAAARFDLNWNASPFDPQLHELQGSASLDFQNGRLSEVSQGAGRLFGMLSLAALPRRLLLDFSDVFRSGLAFDTLKGSFVLTEGSAYSTDLRLDGPSMQALVVGRTGIAAQDYDQVIVIDPSVSDSLPVAGALAGGPTVGAALLLLSQILKSPLSDIAQVKYRVTGSWSDPVVTEVKTENTDEKNKP